MRFGARWIHWINRCVLVASVSILVNGFLGPQFLMEHGLKQGCPLSHFLFNLVAEVFLIQVSQSYLKVDFKGSLFWGFLN